MRFRIAILLLLLAIIARLTLALITPKITKTDLGYSISGKKQAVVTHGGLANVESMLPWAYALADQDYGIELINLPNHGSWHSTAHTSTKAKNMWKTKARSYNPKLAVGHSLGASTVIYSGIFPRVLIGRKAPKRSKQYLLRGSLFPSWLYLLDHVLEPWNPLLLEKGLQKLNHTPKEKSYIWAYCFLPWVVFFCGLLSAIFIVSSGRW